MQMKTIQMNFPKQVGLLGRVFLERDLLQCPGFLRFFPVSLRVLPGLGAILSRSQGTATSRAACEERETSGDVFVMFCLGFALALPQPLQQL